MTAAELEIRKRQIYQDLERVDRRIRNLLFALQQIETGQVPNYWVLLNPGKHNSQRIGRKQELMAFLAELRNLRRKLDQLEKELRLEVIRAIAKNRKSMKRILDQAVKKRGHLTDDEEEQLQGTAEESLRISMNWLITNPSRENIKTVLNTLADAYMVGGGESLENRAMKAMGDAARVGRQRAEGEFLRDPTQANLKKITKSVAEMQLLGAEVGDDIVATKPPRSAHGASHIVRRDETLALISKTYYGQVNYWHVIYFKNAGVIGNNPDRLQIGTKLTIP